MHSKLPISVIIVTRGEAHNLPRCLSALQCFNDVIIVDTPVGDDTPTIAASFGVRYIPFHWNGRYPKKRQWCLDTLDVRYERVFFVDADEVVTTELVDDIAALSWECAGYFVRGRYVVDGVALRAGLMNNKLVLFDRRSVDFPVVDDLDIPGMGEIEGHYQPVLKHADATIGQVRSALLHYAADDEAAWRARHERYAQWEAQMILRDAYPDEAHAWRRLLKKLFRRIPCRGACAFLHSYGVKGGFIDGGRGLRWALRRREYYTMVSAALLTASKAPAPIPATPTRLTARQK